MTYVQPPEKKLPEKGTDIETGQRSTTRKDIPAEVKNPESLPLLYELCVDMCFIFGHYYHLNLALLLILVP